MLISPNSLDSLNQARLGFIFRPGSAHRLRNTHKVEGAFAMPKVSDRYRGTTEYVLILSELVRAAQYRGVTTYQDLAVVLGLPTRGSHLVSDIGHLLGEITEDEVALGRPMLSAVVVASSGRPGSGFFHLARALGRLTGGTEQEEAFWQRELNAVHQTWRRPLLKVPQGAVPASNAQ